MTLNVNPHQKSQFHNSSNAVATYAVYVKCTQNNTIASLVHKNGVKAWVSAGQKFRGAKKSTPYAAECIAKELAEKAMKEFNVKIVKVMLNGPGMCKEAFVKGLETAGLVILEISDTTRMAYNGTRKRKKRRV